MTGAYSLILDGDLELYDGEAEDGAYWFETLAQGASFGDPVPIEAAVASLLRDGSLVERTSDGNRVVTFQIKVKSTDPPGVAQGRARLDLALGKRTTLVWRDGDYPATVFVVETSSLVRPNGFDDVEYLRNEETVAVRFECLPHTRSLTLITDDAEAPPYDGGTQFFDGESSTGWTNYGTSSTYPGTGTGKTVDTSLFVEGTGSLRVQPYYGYQDIGGDGVDFSAFVNRDVFPVASMATGSGGYVSIVLRRNISESDTPRVWMTTVEGGEAEVSFIATDRLNEGFVRYTWPVVGSLTVTQLRFETVQVIRGRFYQHGVDPAPYVWYEDFRLLDAVSSSKQVTKLLTVKGSAPAEGSLHVASASDSVALSKVLVATAATSAVPDGYRPDMRRFITNGASTPDADAPSGSYVLAYGDYGSPDAARFDAPADMFAPGAYTAILVGELQAGSDFDVIGVRAQLLVDGVGVGPYSEALLYSPDAVYSALEFHYMPLGALYLPPTPVASPGSDVKVRFEFRGNNAELHIDDLLLIPALSVSGRPVADYTIVDCGTGAVEVGGASSHLWIDAPSATQPQGGYWRGPDSTRMGSQSAWADAQKPGVHSFKPGSLTTWVLSMTAPGPRVDLTYPPSWYGPAAI